jgi:hypothetical protein
MEKTEQQLDDEREALVAEGEQVEKEERSATEKKHIWIGKCYLWWREAQKLPGYLERRYDEAHIAYNKTANRTNFRPVLTLLSEHKISSTELTATSKALNEIDDEVINNSSHYADDAENKIAYLIKSNGGVYGLAGYHKKAEEDEDEETEQAIETALFTLDDKEFEKGFLKLAKVSYPTQSQPQLDPSTPVNTDADGFSVAVIASDATSTSIIDTIDNPKLLEPLLIHAYRNDLSVTHDALRAILEPIHILATPYALIKYADKYKEFGNEKDPWDTKRKRRTERKFTYRAKSNDILFSYEYTDASSVVIAKPLNPFISNSQSDLFLRTGAFVSAELNLLTARMFNAFEPVNIDGVRKTPKGSISFATMPITMKTAMLDTLSNNEIGGKTLLRHVSNLSHPPFSFVPYYADYGEHVQVIADTTSFTPTWTATVSLKWLREYRSAFCNRWINEYGSKAVRDMNKFVNASFSQQSVITEWEHDPTLGYAVNASLDLPQNIAFGAATIQARTVDYVFIINQIASLPITSHIQFATNEHAARINFATAVSEYEVWLPACDNKGVRDATHFANYNTVQAPQLEWDVNEEAAPEFTDADKKELESNIKRIKERDDS